MALSVSSATRPPQVLNREFPVECQEYVRKCAALRRTIPTACQRYVRNYEPLRRLYVRISLRSDRHVGALAGCPKSAVPLGPPNTDLVASLAGCPKFSPTNRLPPDHSVGRCGDLWPFSSRKAMRLLKVRNRRRFQGPSGPHGEKRWQIVLNVVRPRNLIASRPAGPLQECPKFP